MKKLHIIFGIVMAVVFLLTGQFMRHRIPPVHELNETVRMLYRSTHIYILAGSLVNMGVGSYYLARAGRRQRIVQLIGSLFIIIAPLLLLLAFAIEPLLPGLQRPYTMPAIIMLALGTLLHLISGLGGPKATAERVRIR